MTRRLATIRRTMVAGATLAAAAWGNGTLVGCVGAGDDVAFFSNVDGGAGDARPGDGAAGDARTEGPVDGSPDLREASGGQDAGADSTLLDGGGDGPSSADSMTASVVFSASKLDLGPVGCGSSGKGTLLVTNNGSGQLTLTASTTAVSRGGMFVVSPTSLVLAHGVTGTLTVTIANVPQSTSAGTVLLGALDILTNDRNNANVAPIALQATATGATLAYLENGQGVVTFPTTKVGAASAPVSFALANVGNVSASFAIGPPSKSAFSLSQFLDSGVSATLLPGETWPLNAQFTPVAADAESATASISVDPGTIVCGSSLERIAFAGTGTQAKLTGAPSSPLQFAAGCGGAAPAPQKFTISNDGPVEARITAMTAAPFFLSTPSTSPIVIPGGGSSDFIVTALPYPTQSAATATKLPPILRGTLVLTPDSSADGGTADPPIVIALEEDPHGAVLNFEAPNPGHSDPSAPFSGNFDPVVVLQQSAPRPLDLTNAGNAPAQVTLAVMPPIGADAGPGNAADSEAAGAGSPVAFALLGANAGEAVAFVLPAAPAGAASSVQPESIVFSPSIAGGNIDSLVMSVDPSTVLCAALPSPVTLSGKGLGFGPSISTTDLHFPAPCDGTTVPLAQTFSVANAGSQDMSWWLSDITGPGAGQYGVASVIDAGTTGSTQPGVLHLLHKGEISSVTVAVLAAMPSARAGEGGVPASAPSPEALVAQLTVNTDVHSDSPHVVGLHEVPLGDRLRIPTRALAFAPSPIAATTMAQVFDIRNDASPDTPAASLALTSSNPAAFSVTSSPVSLPPGGDVPASVAFAPATAVAYVETLIFSTTDLLCDPLPQPIRLSGTGTQGLPVFSTSQLAFGEAGDPVGLVNCGATGHPQTFTVTNDGTQAFNIVSLALAKGAASPFSVQTPTPLPVVTGVGQSVTITVLPNPIPQNLPSPSAVNDPSAYGDKLLVGTDVPGDAPHPLALAMQPRGAIITGTPALNTSWIFGTVSFGSIATLPNAVTNVGNSPASVALTSVSYPSVFTLANNTVPPTGGVTALIGQFTPDVPNRSWIDQGTLTLTPSTTFCESLPAQWGGGASGQSGISAIIHLTGSSEGSQPPVTFTGGLAFGGTRCGNGPPAPQDIALTNNTNQTFDINASLRFGAHYRFAIGGPGDGGAAALPPFGRATITVSPQPVVPGQGVRSGSDAYADSLAVSVGPAASPVATSVFPISWSLSGAVLSLPFGAGDHNANGVPFYVADSAPGGLVPISNTGTDTVSVLFGGSSLVMASPNPIDAVAGDGAQALFFSTNAATACPPQPGGTPVLTTVTLSTPPGAPICQPFSTPVVNVLSCVGTIP